MNKLKNLTIGTIIIYNDMANVDAQFVILDTFSDKFGTWVNVMNLDSRTIEPMSANGDLDNRWTY